MQNATVAADSAAQRAENATAKAEALYQTEEALDATLAAQRELYEQMAELKTGIALNVDGGSPHSVDYLICDGGTPYTTEEIVIDGGKP